MECISDVMSRPTSLGNSLTTLTMEAESAVDLNTRAEYMDEYAIDDDDSSDWEGCIDDNGKPCVDNGFFQRVDSIVKLTSRLSLITIMLAQRERAESLGKHTSQFTSAIPPQLNRPSPVVSDSLGDFDEGPLMMKDIRQSDQKPVMEVPRSHAQAIAAVVLSPRTTHRNMLSTELTESLRRHLLWERQQKLSTANVVLKSRHQSHDAANLKQYPQKPCMKQSEDVNFFKEIFNNGYHYKGW